MNSVKIARFAQLPTIAGFTWKWLALLAGAGVMAGLALALVKSLPVS
jgi:hypothetical protein